MTMPRETTTPDIRFLHRDEERPPEPTSVMETNTELMHTSIPHEIIREVADLDVNVFDAVNHGWYVYPKEPFTITPDPSPDGMEFELTDAYTTVTPAPAIDDMTQNPSFAGFINTGWHTAIESETALLITSPLYDFNACIVPHTHRNSPEPTPLTLPFYTESPVQIRADEPIAQILPVSTAYTDTPEPVTSPYTDEMKRKITSKEGLSDISNNAYHEFVHTRKPGTRITHD